MGFSLRDFPWGKEVTPVKELAGLVKRVAFKSPKAIEERKPRGSWADVMADFTNRQFENNCS
jgi:hypothetical protein